LFATPSGGPRQLLKTSISPNLPVEGLNQKSGTKIHIARGKYQ
jgi:hypothetical protein